MQKKISIIGGAGFVGTNLCKQLSMRQKDFEIIDLKLSKQFPEKSKIADIRDINELKNAITGDLVINLAAVHRDDITDKSEYQTTNVDGAINLVSVCNEKCINKIIFTSSVAVYGFAEPGTDELGKISPFNDYGRTKFEAEEVLRKWGELDGNSLLIVRPTVIFGEGNRGNVYNLFNQIASRKFLMVGSGKNKKSMAYIANIVAFLERCIDTNQKYGLYNYIDTPDLTMNELVSQVRFQLNGKSNVGVRLPYFMGMIMGYCADIISKLIHKKLPVSSIRVKKFTSPSEFKTSKGDLDEFYAPFSLLEGIQNTIKSEFIDPDPNREIFFTE